MALRTGRRIELGLAAVVIAMTAGAAQASAISGNFCSVANVQNPPAGAIPTTVWNDFTSVAGFGGFGSSSTVLYEDGTLSGTTVTWGGSNGVSQNTNDNVSRPGDISDGHDEMMTGYLQASRFGGPGYVPTITLDVSNLNVAAFGGSYDVILYFDGDGDVESQNGAASFAINDGVNVLPVVYGRDAGAEYAVLNDGTAPLSWYKPITSTDALNPTINGNYVVFAGLTGSSFTATVTGTLNQQGAALNGFQIVPEPTSWLLLSGGLLMALRRRP